MTLITKEALLEQVEAYNKLTDILDAEYGDGKRWMMNTVNVLNAPIGQIIDACFTTEEAGAMMVAISSSEVIKAMEEKGVRNYLYQTYNDRRNPHPFVPIAEVIDGLYQTQKHLTKAMEELLHLEILTGRR